jgi:hypothetical protein
MATTWCPDLSGDPAIMAVGEAHTKFRARGDQTYEIAVANLDALNQVQWPDPTFTISFDFDGQLTPFHRPAKPVLDEAALEFRDPGIAIGPAPAFDEVPVVFEDAPQVDAQPPSLVFGAKPTAPAISAPPPPPAAAPISMPDAPDYVLPAVPTMETLNLPDAPAIVIPEFQGERPVFIEPPFNEDWTFEATPYTQTLVQTLTDTLRPMIVGSPALPALIEDLLYNRGRSRIELETGRAIDAAFADTGGRGFSEPQGVTFGRVAELRQGGQNAMAEVTRDILIKQIEESLANQRLAIAQGAALEGTLIQLHLEEQRILLGAAQFQRESALAVLNFRIQVFNARLQAYQTDAAVLRDQIQARLAQIEVFRAQIEGERARGEINEQRVRMYVAQLQGVQTMAEFYRQQVEAVKVRGDIDMQAIERYRAEVQAYAARWDAHATEWRGYIAGVEGESKKVDMFRAMVDAQTKNVDAWETKGTFAIRREELRMAQHSKKLEVWGAGLRQLDTMLGAERARLAAVGQSADAKARIYTAEATVEQAASAASDRSFELGLAKERAHLDAQLQTAQAQIQKALGILAQYVEVQRAKAQISSQLAASTMSAVNYGASLSSGRSSSKSCSQNFSFQGEIADA